MILIIADEHVMQLPSANASTPMKSIDAVKPSGSDLESGDDESENEGKLK